MLYVDQLIIHRVCLPLDSLLQGCPPQKWGCAKPFFLGSSIAPHKNKNLVQLLNELKLKIVGKRKTIYRMQNRCHQACVYALKEFPELTFFPTKLFSSRFVPLEIGNSHFPRTFLFSRNSCF